MGLAKWNASLHFWKDWALFFHFLVVIWGPIRTMVWFHWAKFHDLDEFWVFSHNSVFYFSSDGIIWLMHARSVTVCCHHLHTKHMMNCAPFYDTRLDPAWCWVLSTPPELHRSKWDLRALSTLLDSIKDKYNKEQMVMYRLTHMITLQPNWAGLMMCNLLMYVNSCV